MFVFLFVFEWMLEPGNFSSPTVYTPSRLRSSIGHLSDDPSTECSLDDSGDMSSAAEISMKNEFLPDILQSVC